MKDEISFTEFAKLELRVGKVVEAVVPEGSEKLIKLRVSFGKLGERTIFAGVEEWYEPESLVGKRYVFVYNLAPKKTPFGESEGMILAAGEEKPELLEVKSTKEGELVR